METELKEILNEIGAYDVLYGVGKWLENDWVNGNNGKCAKLYKPKIFEHYQNIAKEIKLLANKMLNDKTPSYESILKVEIKGLKKEIDKLNKQIYEADNLIQSLTDNTILNQHLERIDELNKQIKSYKNEIEYLKTKIEK